MSLEDFKQEIRGIELKPYNGELVDSELEVDEIQASTDEGNFFITLDEPVVWSEAQEQALAKLAERHIDKEIKESRMAPYEGGEKQSVRENTKLFKVLLVVGYCQPCPTETVGEAFDDSEGSSLVGNANYKGYVKPVASDGSKKYYCLTIQGWKQIIGIYGVEDWENKAEMALESSNWVVDDEDEEEAQGLDSFAEPEQ